MKHRYTWGLGIDRLAAVQDSAGTHFYAASDELGSVRALAKRDGTWVRSTWYRPYGLVQQRDTAPTPQLDLRYQWTGREYDAETGWYFHRARYYDPAAGRFVQEDPIGYEGGANWYAYVGGRALEARDPSGLDCVTFMQPAFHIMFTMSTPGSVDVYDGGGRVITNVFVPAGPTNLTISSFGQACLGSTGGAWESKGGPESWVGYGPVETTPAFPRARLASTPKPKVEGESFGVCWARVTDETFSTTNEVVFGTPLRIMASAGATNLAARATGSTGLPSVLIAYYRYPLTSAGQRLLLSVQFGQVYTGSQALLTGLGTSAVNSLLVYGAFEFGVALGSMATGLGVCAQ